MIMNGMSLLFIQIFLKNYLKFKSNQALKINMVKQIFQIIKEFFVLNSNI